MQGTKDMNQATKSSNLFHIYFDQIEKTLAEANETLINEVQAHIDKVHLINSKIINNESVSEIKNILDETLDLIKKVSSARLNDGRPFSDATKKVESWFKPHEEILKDVRAALVERLDEYVQRLSTKDYK